MSTQSQHSPPRSDENHETSQLVYVVKKKEKIGKVVPVTGHGGP
jgi:hypothetical protein